MYDRSPLYLLEHPTLETICSVVVIEDAKVLHYSGTLFETWKTLDRRVIFPSSAICAGFFTYLTDDSNPSRLFLCGRFHIFSPQILNDTNGERYPVFICLFRRFAAACVFVIILPSTQKIEYHLTVVPSIYATRAASMGGAR